MRSLGVIGLLAGASVALAWLTPNPELTAWAAASFWVIVYATWRPGELPALPFAALMQWVASSLALLRANALGLELWATLPLPGLETAVALSLLAVTVFAVTARIGLGWHARPMPDLPAAAGGLERRLLIAWGLASAIPALAVVSPLSGLSQLVLGLANLKWVSVLLLFFVALRRGRWTLLWIVLVVEVGLGSLAFFSSFRTPLYLLAIAFAAAGKPGKVRTKQWIGAAAIGALTLVVGIAWQAIKTDYRAFLSGGTGAQVIRHDITAQEQLSTLTDLIAGLGDRDTGLLVDDFILRMSYVDYFAATISYVPAVRPHEHGQRVVAALGHVFMPRLFFPNKPVINDTEDTARYTGVRVEDFGRHTSVCLGYPAEAYIDGGPMHMAWSVAFFGLVIGFIARRFATQQIDPLLGALMVAVIFVGVATIELSFKKLIGSAFILLIVFEGTCRFVLPRLSAWLWRGTMLRATPARSVPKVA
jgi:hypothetical protein